VLAGRADWLRGAEPYLAGGGATALVTGGARDGLRAQWRTDEGRHEAGSPNVIGAYAIASACRALTEAGPEALLAHELTLLRRAREGLAAIGPVHELSLFGPRAPRVAVLSFVVDGRDSAEFARELSERYGIGVRTGLFCAQPLVRLLLDGLPGGAGRAGRRPADAGCDGSLRAIRASFGAGTPPEHIDRLVRAVGELASARAPGGQR
jgi:selenocysteine lyase/cysteine desulfurase